MERSLNVNNPCTLLTPNDNGSYYPLKSIVKLAAGDLDDSFLTLYPSSRFEGNPVIVNDQGSGHLEQGDFTLGSWALTGGQPFTIFDGEYFEGSSTCILADDDAKGQEGGISIAVDMQPKLVVRSVKFGCDGKTKNFVRGDQVASGIQAKSGFVGYENVPKFIEIY